ncbi:hypothetical protein FQN50_005154 [Emmonsiellopsis sp. PD_5]|nr:hypothetical protein FQN50_005154 [Emmonsiellopsis sp. PD_5]
MLFQPAKLLLMAVALGSLLCTVASVDIAMYTQNSCRGTRAVCRRIRQNSCCWVVGSRRAQSARLLNARPRDQLIVTRRRGNNDCAQRVAKGTGCISRGGRYDGAFWCRGCRILDGDGAEGVKAAEEGGEKCTRVEPDLLKIGDKWVEVNDTTPEVDKRRLWGLMDSDGAEAIPNDLLKYVTAPPDLGEEDMGDDE